MSLQSPTSAPAVDLEADSYMALAQAHPAPLVDLTSLATPVNTLSLTLAAMSLSGPSTPAQPKNKNKDDAGNPFLRVGNVGRRDEKKNEKTSAVETEAAKGAVKAPLWRKKKPHISCFLLPKRQNSKPPPPPPPAPSANPTSASAHPASHCTAARQKLALDDKKTIQRQEQARHRCGFADQAGRYKNMPKCTNSGTGSCQAYCGHLPTGCAQKFLTSEPRTSSCSVCGALCASHSPFHTSLHAHGTSAAAPFGPNDGHCLASDYACGAEPCLCERILERSSVHRNRTEHGTVRTSLLCLQR